MNKLESMVTSKPVLYGGAALAVIVGVVFIMRASASGTANAGTDAIDPTAAYLAASSTPGIYSGADPSYATGATDTSGAASGSGLDYLNSLLDFQRQQETDSTAYQTSELASQQVLGLASINSTQAIALDSDYTTRYSTAADLAKSTTEALVNGKLAGISGTLTSGDVSIAVDYAALSRNTKKNTALQSPTGITPAIVLPTGQTVSGRITKNTVAA